MVAMGKVAGGATTVGESVTWYLSALLASKLNEHRQSLAGGGHPFAHSTLGRWLRGAHAQQRRLATTSAKPSA